MRRYVVLFRAHDATAAINRKPRPLGIEKKTLIQMCFRSLVEALAPVAHRIHVIGDDLSEESLEFFRGLDVEITNEKLGPTGSLMRTIDLAGRVAEDDWVYLCEDDYLHRVECFEWIDELLEGRETYLQSRPKAVWKRLLYGGLERHPLFLFPADVPVFYGPRRLRHSLIFQSEHCYWRQIDGTTFTFMTQGRNLDRRRHILEDCAKKMDARRRSRRLYARYVFWNKALCLSPLPGLSSHLHEGTMARLGGWDALLRDALERAERERPRPGVAAAAAAPEG